MPPSRHVYIVEHSCSQQNLKDPERDVDDLSRLSMEGIYLTQLDADHAAKHLCDITIPSGCFTKVEDEEGLLSYQHVYKESEDDWDDEESEDELSDDELETETITITVRAHETKDADAESTMQAMELLRKWRG